MRKASFAIILSVVLLLGLSACGSSDGETVSTVTGDPDATVATGPVSSASPGGTYTTVDVLTAFDALKAGDGGQMVDVREPNEWLATGVAVNSVLIPLGELEQRAPGELAKDQPVYVICRTGNRSRTGSETLVKLGYSEVYNVDGGIEEWMKAGLPMETYTP